MECGRLARLLNFEGESEVINRLGKGKKRKQKFLDKEQGAYQKNTR